MNDISAAVRSGDITLPKILRHWAHTTPNALAFQEKEFGIWNGYSWSHYYETVKRFAMGLRALGFKEQNRLGIASEDTPEWIYADLAAQALGGIMVGVYPTNPWPELQYILNYSNASFVVCGDQEQVDKVLDAMTKHEKGLPELVKIICVDMKGLRHYKLGDLLVSFHEVLTVGDEYIARSASHANEFENAVEATQPDDVSILIFTSGTTGPPKGAQLSARNMLVPVEDIARNLGLNAKNFSIVCYLPLCHVAEHSFSTVLQLITGGIVNFAESIDTVNADLREIAPSVFLGVSRIWEKAQQTILIKMKESTRFRRWAFDRCMESGRKLFERTEAKGGKRSIVDRLHFFCLWLLMFRNLQRYLGYDRLICSYSGGASVSPEVLKFFRIIGLPAYQLYGLSESGVIFYQRPGAERLGACGLPIDGLEYRVTEVGELLVRHAGVFRGYIHDPGATKKAIVDGWLHTGDVVEFADNGELCIVDRKKAIIVTRAGKHISPSTIENVMKDSFYIREVVVVGEDQQFLAGLIQIDLETVGKWAQERNLAYTTYRSLALMPEVRELVETEVRRVNKLLAPEENIHKFIILEKELDHDDGELTATQKVRREMFEKKFAKEMQMIYEQAA